MDTSLLGSGGRSTRVWESTIDDKTNALKTVTDPTEESNLLCARSKAFSSLAAHLRQIPAAASERSAIYGLDPTHLATLALRDSCKAAQLQPSLVEAFAQQGIAHVLLEHYTEAQAALLEGLALEPGHAGMHASMAAVDAAIGPDEDEPESPTSPAAGPAKRARSVARELDDMECILCLKLLYEPVTTPCGHSFCKPCFVRSTDHGNKCPCCRTVLHVGRSIPVSITLKNILEKTFPEEYAARRQEEGHGAPAPGENAALPLFVMSPMLPGEKMALNIFEPRYRLMVRRCMEGSRRLGMAIVTTGSGLHDVATECEIMDCQPLPDGRYYLEIVGRRRFHITRAWEQDGYRVADAEFFSDEAPEEGSTEAVQLAETSARVGELATQIADRLKTILPNSRQRDHFAGILERVGERPDAEDHEALSFWAMNIFEPFMQSTSDTVKMLSSTSSTERLGYCREMLSTFRGHSACTMQ